MGRELFTGLSGATAAQAQLEVLADNIANSRTSGFKAARLAFTVDGVEEEGLMYAQATSTYHDMSPGALEQTENPYDLAIDGPGFLRLEDELGTVRLSRTVHLSQDEEGYLTVAGAGRLIAQGGPVQLAPGESFSVAGDGTIMGSEQGTIDRLEVVNGQVEALGEGLWSPAGDLEPNNSRLVQGAREGSNVDTMRTMVELIEASRYFEAYQKAMQSSDEMDSTLNNLGGR